MHEVCKITQCMYAGECPALPPVNMRASMQMKSACMPAHKVVMCVPGCVCVCVCAAPNTANRFSVYKIFQSKRQYCCNIITLASWRLAYPELTAEPCLPRILLQVRSADAVICLIGLNFVLFSLVAATAERRPVIFTGVIMGPCTQVTPHLARSFPAGCHANPFRIALD